MKHTIKNPLRLLKSQHLESMYVSANKKDAMEFVSKEPIIELVNASKDILDIIREFQQESEDIFNNDDLTKIANFRKAIKEVEI